MKLLFIGSANSFLIVELARHLRLIDPKIRIDILSADVPDKIDPVFEKCFYVKNTSRLARMKYVKVLYYAWTYKKALRGINENYRAVHVFYVSVIYRMIWRHILRMGSKHIITVFGSDFYKSGTIMRKMLGRITHDADIITGTNLKTLESFTDYFDIAPERIRICRFGLSVLDELDTITQQDVDSFKRQYGIPYDKYVVACGYNASTNQNLEMILEQFRAIRKELDQVFITFQFHGVRNDYTFKVEQSVQELEVDYMIFDQRFSNRELAIYRRVVDCMIQLQTTDQLSGAMQEHLYAGSTVITGNWLPYEIFDESKVDYVRINDFQDLREVFPQALNKQVDYEQNQRVISGLSKWSETIDSWLELYNE